MNSCFFGGVVGDWIWRLLIDPNWFDIWLFATKNVRCSKERNFILNRCWIKASFTWKNHFLLCFLLLAHEAMKNSEKKPVVSPPKMQNFTLL